MKILETQSATLTNHEVLTHLTTHPSLSLADDKHRHSNTSTIVAEVRRYLTSSSSSSNASAPANIATSPHAANAPPALADAPPETANADASENAFPPTTDPSPLPPPLSTPQIQNLVHALSRYNLTKAETLMILNLGVRELGLLDCVVEECDERLGSEEQEALCAVVGGCFGAGGGEGEVRMVDV
ncbi:MAG: hypothetical protein L6R36_006199 [Xanthoria steineri]|nr:MAG: hypothetical protein L6R36_006199 [Xanthoria steineri]